MCLDTVARKVLFICTLFVNNFRVPILYQTTRMHLAGMALKTRTVVTATKVKAVIPVLEETMLLQTKLRSTAMAQVQTWKPSALSTISQAWMMALWREDLWQTTK